MVVVIEKSLFLWRGSFVSGGCAQSVKAYLLLNSFRGDGVPRCLWLTLFSWSLLVFKLTRSFQSWPWNKDLFMSLLSRAIGSSILSSEERGLEAHIWQISVQKSLQLRDLTFFGLFICFFLICVGVWKCHFFPLPRWWTPAMDKWLFLMSVRFLSSINLVYLSN